MVERDPSSGHRRYAAGHAQWITFLRDLRACGMPIREIRVYARLVAKGDRARVVASIITLQKHRAVLNKKLRAGCAPGGLRP